jgi:hypothetical protein
MTKWERGKVVGMGWAKLEQLVLVFDTGMVRLYNVHGNFSQFSLVMDNRLMIRDKKQGHCWIAGFGKMDLWH